MLTKVKVFNSRGASIELPLWDSLEGYQVRNIDGLDPAAAIIATSDTARIDGTQYQSQRTGSRNIVITLGLDSPDNSQTVDELRQGLYPFFMPKTNVDMIFYKLDGSEYRISGKVETMEAPLFAEDPEAVISIMCFTPDFVAPNEVEFQVPAGTMTALTSRVVEGNVMTGFRFEYTVPGTRTGFKLEHLNDLFLTESFEVVRALALNNIVRFSTIPRSKSATLQVGTTRSSILNSVTPESEWFSLLPGENFFRLYLATTGGNGRFFYYPRFGGL